MAQRWASLMVEQRPQKVGLLLNECTEENQRQLGIISIYNFGTPRRATAHHGLGRRNWWGLRRKEASVKRDADWSHSRSKISFANFELLAT
jgi:hypothetical protein